jgi:hypothetical protein
VLGLLPVGGLALVDGLSASAALPGLLVFEELELMGSAKLFENGDPIAWQVNTEKKLRNGAARRRKNEKAVL